MEIEKMSVSKKRVIINSLVIFAACDWISRHSSLSSGEIADEIQNWAEIYYLRLKPTEKESFVTRFYPPDETM